MELGIGELDHQRIDFINCVAIPGLSIAGQGSDAQADDPDANAGALARCQEREANA